MTNITTQRTDIAWCQCENIIRGDLGYGFLIPCLGEVVDFESTVLVDFDGFDEDPRDVTRVEWMEQGKEKPGSGRETKLVAKTN